jgi:ribosomal protein S18 acetylase RimI-like enzyme
MVEESSVVLVHEKKIVGFTFVLAFGKNFLFLDWIGIHPEYRRQGFGTLLLRFIMSQAQNRGVNTMGLSCELDNEVALRIYERNEWIRTNHDVTYVWKKQK